MKLHYYTEGARAWIVEPDGTTVCEVLTLHGGEPAASVAAGIVSRLNAIDETVEALKAIRAKVEALEAML
jgi:hypothetical protein